MATSSLEWKLVAETYEPDSSPEGYTYAAKVPGGWLISVWAGANEDQRWGGGITFLPDPNYTWNPKFLKKFP